MRVMLITGYKGSGKSTVAEYLAKNYGIELRTLAKPIKDIGSQLFDWGKEEAEGSRKETLDPIWGITPREFYQWFGTEIMQNELMARFPRFAVNHGRTIWCNLVRASMTQPKDYVISDARFPHEVQYFKDNLPPGNVAVIRLVRGKLAPWWKKLFWHPSEKLVDKIKSDIVILNDGTEAQLYTAIDTMMGRLGIKKAV